MLKEYGYSTEDLILTLMDNELNRSTKDTTIIYKVD